MSTSTRVTLPAATRPLASDADTVNVRRRPSIFSRIASATTSPPMAVGRRWSSCTRMPTVVAPSSRRVPSALHVASSQSATTRGVPSTSTQPEPSASAVSDVPTIIFASPRSPVSMFTEAHTTAMRPVEHALRAVGRVAG